MEKKEPNVQGHFDQRIITPSYAMLIWHTYQKEGVEAAKKLHMQLGFKKSSFYEIIGKQGIWDIAVKNAKPKKWNNTQIQDIVKFVNLHPQATLAEIVNEGERRGYPRITISTLHSYLEFQLITLKKVHNIAQERNSINTKKLRWAYATWFLQNQNKHFIYVDEFGFNLGMQRSRGRSTK